MKSLAIAYLAAVVLPSASFAQETPHTLGQHPAVIVKRLSEQQPYDYASKFYPHPAWLYWSAEVPRRTVENPTAAAGEHGRTTNSAKATAPSNSNRVAGAPH